MSSNKKNNSDGDASRQQGAARSSSVSSHSSYKTIDGVKLVGSFLVLCLLVHQWYLHLSVLMEASEQNYHRLHSSSNQTFGDEPIILLTDPSSSLSLGTPPTPEQEQLIVFPSKNSNKAFSQESSQSFSASRIQGSNTSNNNNNNKSLQRICQNDDFGTTPNLDNALFTMIIPTNHHYVDSGRVLGWSVRNVSSMTTTTTTTITTPKNGIDATLNNIAQESSLSFDMVVMDLTTKPLTDADWISLQQAGWTHRCTVEPIFPIRRANKRFKDQFAKLRLWGMEDYYRRIVYLDSDCMALAPLDELFQIQLEDVHHIGLVGGNLGVFLLDTNRTEYERLLQLQQNKSIEYEASIAEQSFFNTIYGAHQKYELPGKFNANMRRYRHKIKKNDEPNGMIPHFHVLHFVIKKPWSDRCDHDLEYCQQWIRIRDMLNQQLNQTITSPSLPTFMSINNNTRG